MEMMVTEPEVCRRILATRFTDLAFNNRPPELVAKNIIVGQPLPQAKVLFHIRYLLVRALLIFIFSSISLAITLRKEVVAVVHFNLALLL